MSEQEKQYKETIVSPINFELASNKEVAKALALPPQQDRQPDLQYMTAIFVSSGMNKNGAVFLGSELIKARNTIDTKAVDVEHDEQTVIGQITESAFLDEKGQVFSAEDASSKLSIEEMDKKEIDIAISAIIHQARFPDIATEIAAGEWMVSMEAFFEDYDLKIGDLIIPREAAAELGYQDLVGKTVLVADGDTELGFHLVGRVLRNITFAGVGLVKNPANEKSVIMEAAAVDEFKRNAPKSGKVINIKDVEKALKELASVKKGPVGSDEGPKKDQLELRKIVLDVINSTAESAAINLTKPGTCVSYKRYLYTFPNKNTDTLGSPANDISQFPLYNHPGPIDTPTPGAEISREHYCALFDVDCAARPGDATSPVCWRNVFARNVREELETFEDVLRKRRLDAEVSELEAALANADTILKK